MTKTRILLVDDHAVLRAGLKVLLALQPDFEVVGEASDGEEALRQVELLKPEVVLMDLSMPGMGGIEATRRIRALYPHVSVLILSQYDDESYLRQALDAGAAGFALKKAADSDLLAAVRAVRLGEAYLHPSLTRILLEDVRQARRDESRREDDDPLSDRERQVLRLVAQGFANQEIAVELVLSVKTVETYKARIAEKLGLRGRAALFRYAKERGLLEED